MRPSLYPIGDNVDFIPHEVYCYIYTFWGIKSCLDPGAQDADTITQRTGHSSNEST